MSLDGIRASGPRRYPRLVVENPGPVADVTINAPMAIEDLSLRRFRARPAVPASAACPIGRQGRSDSLTADARAHLMAAISDAQRIRRRAALLPRTSADDAAGRRW